MGLLESQDAERKDSSNGNWVLGLKIAVLVLAVAVFFHSDLAAVANGALQDESMSYLFAVPFLFGFLLYRKRKMLMAVMPLNAALQPKIFTSLMIGAGLLSVSAVMFAYWYNSNVAVHMLTLPVFAAALTLILFNMQTLKQAAFPLGFLVFLTPPSELINSVGPAFSSVNAAASCAFARLLGVHSILTGVSSGSVIAVTRASGEVLSFNVGTSSSGLYSLIGFLVFVVFLVFIVRDELWKRLLMLPVGFLVIYLLSVGRIAAVLVVGYEFGKDAMMSVFLTAGGWILIFLGTFLVLVFSDRVLHVQVFSKSSPACPVCGSKGKTDQTTCFACGRVLKVNEPSFHRDDAARPVALRHRHPSAHGSRGLVPAS